MVCETDMARGFETCSNCTSDCGPCPERNCSAGLICVFGCFDFGGGGGGGIPIPMFSCLSSCLASVCADGQFFLQQVIDCAVGSFIGGECRDIDCVRRECSSEVMACLRDRC